MKNPLLLTTFVFGSMIFHQRSTAFVLLTPAPFTKKTTSPAGVTTVSRSSGSKILGKGEMDFNQVWGKTNPMSRKSSSALLAGPDPDLAVGFVTIAAACSPYVLGVFFKDFFNDSFFLPVYAEDDDGRIAEIGWKVRYATLGLALTTLAFLEVYFFPENDPARILKDSYIIWAIFYSEATRKIRAEATSDPPILTNPSGRAGIQVWHCTVVLILWADVSESYTGNAITNFLKDVFT